MSIPSVEANLGTVKCGSYHAGHNVHWIPVLRAWVDEPRLAMTIRHIESNKFEITSEGKTEFFYNHNPSAVIKAIQNADPKHFKKVGNTGAITIDKGDGHAWLYFAKHPFVDCETIPPYETPEPHYYERYRFIDKEIARFEEVLLTTTSEVDIQSINQSIEKANQIKTLQQTNTHETRRINSTYQSVCSCGLILEASRKADDLVGHITY